MFLISLFLNMCVIGLWKNINIHVFWNLICWEHPVCQPSDCSFLRLARLIICVCRSVESINRPLSRSSICWKYRFLSTSISFHFFTVIIFDQICHLDFWNAKFRFNWIVISLRISSLVVIWYLFFEISSAVHIGIWFVVRESTLSSVVRLGFLRDPWSNPFPGQFFSIFRHAGAASQNVKKKLIDLLVFPVFLFLVPLSVASSRNLLTYFSCISIFQSQFFSSSDIMSNFFSTCGGCKSKFSEFLISNMTLGLFSSLVVPICLILSD